MKGFKGEVASRIAVREHWEDEASQALQVKLDAIAKAVQLALEAEIDREDPVDRAIWNFWMGNCTEVR